MLHNLVASPAVRHHNVRNTVGPTWNTQGDGRSPSRIRLRSLRSVVIGMDGATFPGITNRTRIEDKPRCRGAPGDQGVVVRSVRQHRPLRQWRSGALRERKGREPGEISRGGRRPVRGANRPPLGLQNNYAASASNAVRFRMTRVEPSRRMNSFFFRSLSKRVTVSREAPIICAISS